MPLLPKDEVFRRFQKLGRNSSHFVWLLAELEFFEASNGWVFGYLMKGETMLLALEPLMPDPEPSVEDFRAAWAELVAHARPGVALFISVYAPFLGLLEKSGFKGVKVGQEPWVDLADCIPTGNAGKGVRSARNQAIHAGITVEEWAGAELAGDERKRATLLELLSHWKKKHALELPAFMNAVDPLAFPEARRYFVAKTPEGEVCGFLVASPVPAADGYFLEDLVMGRHAPRGAGELLTLEALVALQASGVSCASLGVISMTSIEPEDGAALPSLIRFILLRAPGYLRKFYNFDGLEIFRKRFKPKHWEKIHLALWRAPGRAKGETSDWLRGLVALGRAFRPRLNLTWERVADSVMAPLRRYPIAFFAGTVALVLFGTINEFGQIPEWALSRFGFSASAPFSEWLERSVISDFLYFEPGHFWVWNTTLVFLLAWAERTHKRRFILPFCISCSILDDFINYAVIVKPFEYFQPHLFKHLIAVKDVGGSLTMVALVGLQICTFRRNREILFTILSLGIVMGFVFSTMQYQSLVLNLNHFLFLCLGFISGKLKFEYDRAQSRKASKGKPPPGRSVLESSRRPAGRKRRNAGEAA